MAGFLTSLTSQSAVPRDRIGMQPTTISNTNETTVLTQEAATFNDLIALFISNTSASSSARIDIRDDVAGTIICSLQSVGGAGPVGFVVPAPLPQSNPNKNWTVQASGSVSDLRVFALFAKMRQ